MKLIFYGFLALPCWVALSASAQMVGAGGMGGTQLVDLTDPADAKVSVPAVVYRSVFADTPTGVEQETADWRKANAEVGQFRRGHVDILKWEAEQEARRKAAMPPVPSIAPSPSGMGSKP